MTDQPLTEAEASAFSDRLEAFSQTLTDREQLILDGLLANAVSGAPAAGADAEVAGFASDACLKIDGIEGASFDRLTTHDLSQTALAPITGRSIARQHGDTSGRSRRRASPSTAAGDRLAAPDRHRCRGLVSRRGPGATGPRRSTCWPPPAVPTVHPRLR